MVIYYVVFLVYGTSKRKKSKGIAKKQGRGVVQFWMLVLFFFGICFQKEINRNTGVAAQEKGCVV